MKANGAEDDPDCMLRVARLADECRVLGPGKRFVVWVQGCPFSCRGCVAAETLDPEAGNAMDLGSLADRIAGTPGLDGVTLSGGEPFAQASGLARLLEKLEKSEAGLSVMSYTGYRLEWLTMHGSESQRALLSRVDILVDGLYRAGLHANLLWRGSTNQRIHFLSDRHADARSMADESAGLEFSFDVENRLAWAGVPPIPGFREQLSRRLDSQGLSYPDGRQP